MVTNTIVIKDNNSNFQNSFLVLNASSMYRQIRDCLGTRPFYGIIVCIFNNRRSMQFCIIAAISTTDVLSISTFVIVLQVEVSICYIKCRLKYCLVCFPTPTFDIFHSCAGPEFDGKVTRRFSGGIILS